MAAAVSCSNPKVEGGAGGVGGGGGGRGGGGTGDGGGLGPGPVGSIDFDGGVSPSTGGSAGRNPGSGEVCEIERFNLERLPPEVLLLLDRSRSMDQRDVVGSTNTRWDEMRPAIVETVTQTTAGVNWGLLSFPSPNGCNVANNAEVAVAPNNGEIVGTTISMMQLNSGQSGTPTGLVVARGVSYLQTLTTRNPKFLLLATDGEPTCGGNASAEAVAAVTAARAAGFDVFVVGMRTDSPEALRDLNAMADAGGRARAADPKFYPADNRAELASALTAITADIGTCLFSFANTPADPNNVGVEIGGTLLPRSDWSYGAGMTSIQLGGAACDKVKSGTAGEVRILFGCPNKPIQ